MSDALAASRAEAARNHELLQRALERPQAAAHAAVFADPADEPPPPHY